LVGFRRLRENGQREAKKRKRGQRMLFYTALLMGIERRRKHVGQVVIVALP
jgi:hypothetical protein